MLQRHYRRRAARRKALEELNLRGGSHSGSVKMQRMTQEAHEQALSRQSSRQTLV